jgi:hypothetical protein
MGAVFTKTGLGCLRLPTFFPAACDTNARQSGTEDGKRQRFGNCARYIDIQPIDCEGTIGGKGWLSNTYEELHPDDVSDGRSAPINGAESSSAVLELPVMENV